MWILSVFSSLFLGWGLGANDSANVFGIAVYTKVVRFKTAVVLTAIFVFLGATLEGHKGMGQVGDFAYMSGITNANAAFWTMTAAAITVLILTLMKLPISTSQSVVGAMLGVGMLNGQADFSYATRFFGAWVLTPLAAMVLAYGLYLGVSKAMAKKKIDYAKYTSGIKLGYFLAGVFGAYALGANNVANVTGVVSGALDLISIQTGVILGGLAIAIGVITFSHPVMQTIGERLVPLSPIAGLVVVSASAITVYAYARIGIPVSTSQAVIGGIVGVGFCMGVNTINKRVLKQVLAGWVMTPFLAGSISYLLNSWLA